MVKLAVLEITLLTLFSIQISGKLILAQENNEDTTNSNEDSIKKHVNDLYIASAIRRGIEKLVSESPFRRTKIQKEGLINKIGELIFRDDNIKINSNSENGNTENSNFNEIKSSEHPDNDQEVATAPASESANLNDENVQQRYSSEEHAQESDSEKGERKSDINDDHSLLAALKRRHDRESPANSTKRGLFTKQKPFEGYMKKLSLDVSGVMGDAKDMLRDTGKLIHGLKRVVKGASILTTFTNNAVKYAKYFSIEPSNVTIDYLEEKAIIALIDAQKAANESQKAAKLARIASAKAIDTEKRIESSEGEMTEEKMLIPFVKATEILAKKAEKAAKLAQLEKQKTEKDFVIMNRHLSRMGQVLNKKLVSDDAAESAGQTEQVEAPGSKPEETYFYMKQKQLEKQLLNGTKSTADDIESEARANMQAYSKALKDDDEFKFIADLNKNITHLNQVRAEGKEAVNAISSEIAANLAASTQQNAVVKNSEFLNHLKDPDSSDDDTNAHALVKNDDSDDDPISKVAMLKNISFLSKEKDDSTASGENINEIKSDLKNFELKTSSEDLNDKDYAVNKLIEKSVQPAKSLYLRTEDDIAKNYQQEKKSDLKSGNMYQNIIMSEDTLPADTTAKKEAKQKNHVTKNAELTETAKDERRNIGSTKFATEELKLLNYIDEDISGSTAETSGEADASSGFDDDSSSGDGGSTVAAKETSKEVVLPIKTTADITGTERFAIPKIVKNSPKYESKKRKSEKRSRTKLVKHQQSQAEIEKSYELMDPFGFNDMKTSKRANIMTKRDFKRPFRVEDQNKNYHYVKVTPHLQLGEDALIR